MPIWEKFESAINNRAFDLFNQKTIKWFRSVKSLDPHGEKGKNYQSYQEVELKCLCEYNIFKVWPLDKDSPSGTMDMQNVLIIFNKKYLSDNGWLNSNGYFAFDSGNDYFVLDGIKYLDAGDTQASQSAADNVLFYLILKRDKYETGQQIHNSP